MREAEIGDVLGDGRIGFAVATHDQGVIATIVPKPGAASMPPGPDRWEVKEIDQEKDTFGHEIEFGDLDGDGVVEFYATLSEPNRLDGRDQSGRVMRDRLCRFLTAGDVDGDGKKEMVAAGYKSGLWLLRPGANPKGEWQVQSIDRSSSGFEHTALLTDLDGDGTDELYVASDDQGELRRYVWRSGRFEKEVIHARTPAGSAFTWNLMPVPVELVQ